MTKDEFLKGIRLVYQGTFSGVDIAAWRADGHVLVQLTNGREKRAFVI